MTRLMVPSSLFLHQRRLRQWYTTTVQSQLCSSRCLCQQATLSGPHPSSHAFLNLVGLSTLPFSDTNPLCCLHVVMDGWVRGCHTKRRSIVIRNLLPLCVDSAWRISSMCLMCMSIASTKQEAALEMRCMVIPGQSRLTWIHLWKI